MARFKDELADAISVRTVTLVLGVLILQIGFIASYVGAFHSPNPHRIEVGVVAPGGQATTVAQQIDAIDGHPLKVRTLSSRQQAEDLIRRDEISAALIAGSGSKDRLLVASGGGVALASAVESVFEQIETSQDRTFQTTDIVPIQSGDGRGLTGFYLVIGWIVGGYLVAAVLGIAGGARPANLRRAAIRLGALVPYAVVSGLLGAAVVGPWIGALNGHLLALWGLGALIVFAVGAATMAFQVLAGIAGIGIAVLLFVVLGNPSAGGAYQTGLLPGLWRAVAYALPNGAGTDAVRRIVYFGAHGIGGHFLVLGAWAVAGAAITLVAAYLFHRQDIRHPQTPASDATMVP